jgi:hypothetical protein
MLSQRLPYTKLLEQVSEKLTEATIGLPGAGTRRVTRVGVVSVTVVGENDLPPGLIRFIKHVGQPWGRIEGGFSFQFTTPLDEAPEWKDKCIHNLVRPDGGTDDLITLTLDWHRIFTVGQAINHSILSRMLATARERSDSYFENLAEGSRFDGPIDSPTA